MISEALARLGTLHPERHAFLVKGLRLVPDAEGESPFVRVLRPYADAGEHFVAVVSDPHSTAAALLGTFPHKRCGIVGGGPGPWAVAPGDLGGPGAFDHLVFVNEGAAGCLAFSTANRGSDTGIYVILDYASLRLFKSPDASYCLFDHGGTGWFAAAVADISRNLMEGRRTAGAADGAQDVSEAPARRPYTVIAARPPQQTVRLVFATSDALMHLAIEQLSNPAGTAVYTQAPMRNAIPNCTHTRQTTGLGSFSRFIFGDISCCRTVASVLDQVPDVVILYTTDGFRLLPPIVGMLSSRGVPVPEHIRRIADTDDQASRK